MILSDKSINTRLLYGDLKVFPQPDSEQIQPASLDLRLGEDFVLPDDHQEIHEDGYIVFEPDTRYLATTKETIELPNDLAAQVAGRSSIGRRGLIVHKTAGWIDPGFKGELTFEIYNHGDAGVSIETGTRIAQLVFHELDQPSSGYDGQYQQQEGPTQAGGLQ